MEQTINLSIKITPEIIDAIAKRVNEMQEHSVEHNVAPIKTFLTYTVKEVSRITNKTSQTIIRHITNGSLIAKKSGKSWVITQENLDNYIKP